MNLIVPHSVNVLDLISKLELTPTRRENLKNKIYYFLSNLVVTNDNYKLYEKTGGYRRISSVKMKKILDRQDYYIIKSLLSDPGDPIMESNESWRNSEKGLQKGFCKGYRLAQKYNTGEFEYRSIPDKLTRRINKHLKDQTFDDSKYQFLYDQFKSHKLSFDPEVYTYIKNFGNALLSRIEDNNEYQRNLVLNLIGRWKHRVDNIEKNNLWFRVSSENHRLNSSITHLKRTLRPFLLCDGRPLGFVDIRASQPYIMASIMNDRFLSTEDNGYNMFSIYPKAYNTLIAIKGSSNTGTTVRMYENFSFSGSSVNTEFRQYSGTSICQCSGASSEVSLNPYSFMWGEFLDQENLEDIKKYREIPFEEDFYKYVLTGYQSTHRYQINYCPEERQKFKDNVMYILFDDNKDHRKHIEYIKVFREMFPGADKWITTMHGLLSNDGLSYLLQRAESYLVLDTVCREFNTKYPNAPIFTIHDAVLTFPKYLTDMQQLILERFPEITGIKVGMKSQCLIPNKEPKLEDIDEEWLKIKPIRDQKTFELKQYQVLSSNIDRGTKFLNHY